MMHRCFPSGYSTVEGIITSYSQYETTPPQLFPAYSSIPKQKIDLNSLQIKRSLSIEYIFIDALIGAGVRSKPAKKPTASSCVIPHLL